jgi:hypothetical protein
VVAEPVREWTREEIAEILEKQAWERRGMTAAQLLQANQAGTLEEPGEVADLLALAFLLPENDPLFGSS